MDENKSMKTPNEISKPAIPQKIVDKLDELIDNDTQEWKLLIGDGIFDDKDDTVEAYLRKGWGVYARSEPDNVVLLSRPQGVYNKCKKVYEKTY